MTVTTLYDKSNHRRNRIQDNGASQFVQPTNNQGIKVDETYDIIDLECTIKKKNTV